LPVAEIGASDRSPVNSYYCDMSDLLFRIENPKFIASRAVLYPALDVGNAVVDHKLQPIVPATCSFVPPVGLPDLREYGSSYVVNEVCLLLHGTRCTVPGKLNTF
jgi:hypothetical protein